MNAKTGFLRSLWHRVPKPDSREYIFVTILSLLVSSLGTWATNRLHDHDTYLSHENDAFKDESRALEPAIANYVQRIINGESVDGEPTQILINNLIRQAQFLEDVSPHLNQKDRHLATEYQKLLVSFQATLPESKSVLSMQTFWNSANKLFVVRNKILRSLDKGSST